MIRILNHMRKLDLVLLGASSLLVAIGLVSIHGGVGGSAFQRQAIFFVLGLLIMVAVSFIDWRMFKEDSYLVLSLYSIGITLLLGLFVFAPVIRGVRRWYDLGIVSFDPVEYVKLVLIILLAKYFSGRHVEMYKFSHIVLSGIYVAIPSMITFFQPDLGSSIVLVSLWLGVLLVSGIKTKHLVILILAGIMIFSLGWTFALKDYQKARLTGFFEPRLDPRGINWNPEQARIAIGNGGIFGQGIGEGSQTRHGFLPETETDFIFSAIAEEAGFIGILVLIALILIVVWRILRIALAAPDNFSRLFCSGLAILLLAQASVNIGMNLGLLPIVGIPLPFVSYGGSNLIFTFIALGIVQGIRSGIILDKF